MKPCTIDLVLSYESMESHIMDMLSVFLSILEALFFLLRLALMVSPLIMLHLHGGNAQSASSRAIYCMQTHRLCIALWARSSSLAYYLDVKTGVSSSPWFRGAWVFQSWDINREEIWESSDECLLELWHMLGRQSGVTGHSRHQREKSDWQRCEVFFILLCFMLWLFFFFFSPVGWAICQCTH